MPGRITTSKDLFRVEDITKKPTRFQSDVIYEHNVPEDISIDMRDVPQNATIESAITFFESHATGEYRDLYLKTGLWLRTIMSSKSREQKEEIHSDAEESSEVSEL